MDKEIATLTTLFDTLVEFAVSYGFQILGSLIILLIGLKAAGLAGRQITRLATGKDIDVTLSKFIGNVVKVVLVAFVIVITLGNFGITIAPLIALAGASAFGATIAIQGPLSNYGAGLSIILSRPFVVGDTIRIGEVSGVVEEITLATTVLEGEDGESIRVPNKEIVGQVIVNSDRHRVVETKICIAYETDAEGAIGVLKEALAGFPEFASGPRPQVGIHDFTYGGIVLGLRFWVASHRYFETRYAVNQAALAALSAAGIELLPATGPALAAPSLSADA
jgi:small conductance mechanosensitive channel